MTESTIGILGGGQLCRMMLEACNNLCVKAVVLDSENCPAKQVYRSKEHVDGLFTDEADIERLLQKCDVVTLDLEHINLPALKRLSEKYSRPCFPSIDDLERIQDKFIQKQLYLEAGVSCSHAIGLSGFAESKNLSYALKTHFTQSEHKHDSKPLAIIKKRIGSYDGKGNFILTRETTDDELKNFFGNFDISEFYAEEYVPFIKELAVMVVRTQSGEVFSYPCVETIQEKNICHYVIAPAEIKTDLALEAQKAAKKIVSNLSSAGVFGVELFLLEDGTILANEIAPRPHNSGHYTIEACHYSQFEAHIRAVAGLRITPESIAFKVDGTHAVMVNILGTEPKQYDNYINKIIDNPKLSVHLYGKGESRPLRKMGHFTTIANTYNKCLDNIGPLLNQKLIQKKSNVQVGIIMGSDSDLPVMKQAADILKKFHIEFEVTIVSAHRTPERLFSYAKTAVDRNIKVIIAGAGGAAHLPGMVASLTTLPVIGVPVKGSSLDGVDSLYSIVQMPRGIPVATVAINNAENAGILAARIIGSTDIMVNQKLEQHTTDMQYQVGQKIERLERLGYEDYLNNK